MYWTSMLSSKVMPYLLRLAAPLMDSSIVQRKRATDILGDRTRQQNKGRLPQQGWCSLKMELQHVLDIDVAIKSYAISLPSSLMDLLTKEKDNWYPWWQKKTTKKMEAASKLYECTNFFCKSQHFFSNLSSNCFELLYLRNRQEQVKKALCC